MIAAIERPLDWHENHQTGNSARETEVRALLTTITPAQSLQLGRRIDACVAGDPLIGALSRWTADRRSRLRAFVADHRRRVAVRAAR